MREKHIVQFRLITCFTSNSSTALLPGSTYSGSLFLIPCSLFLSFLLFTNSAHAQNLDSLYTLWQDETQADSSRAKAYKKYIWDGFLFSNPDSAMVLSEGLHSFATKHNYPAASSAGYNLQGIASHIVGSYSKALEYHKKSLQIDEELGDKNGISASLTNIGNAYQQQGNYAGALEYFKKSLRIDKEMNDNKGVSACLTNIGLIYNSQGNNSLALEYHLKSLRLSEETSDESGISTSLHNIGIIYLNQGNYSSALEYLERSLKIVEGAGYMYGIANSLNIIGQCYEGMGNYDTALEYYEQALKIAVEMGAKRRIGMILNNLGSIHKTKSEYTLALEYYQRMMEIFEEIGDQQHLSQSLSNIGLTYQSQGNHILALDYCNRALEIAEEVGVLGGQVITCQCLYDSYKAMGKGNEALEYLEKVHVIKDSLNTEETAKKLQQMEFEKEMLADSIATAEQERLVKEAHQEDMRAEEKTRNVAFGAGALVLLLAGGLYSRLRYVRKSKAIIENEKDRSNNLLLNILPADIAEELKIHGKAEARDFDLVSILFTDFKGFTRTSAKLSAQELVAEINTCFEAFDGIMEKFGIEKIKTIGDAYMAAGGLPVPSTDSVKNTVLAALEMQDFIEKRHKIKDSRGEPAFQMRVGIHTGPVVAGIVGVKKFQYDIWGDTVNTASRIESNGQVGKVNVSQATYELLSDTDTSAPLSVQNTFAFESRGMIEAKGKGEIEMYFVSRNN